MKAFDNRLRNALMYCLMAIFLSACASSPQEAVVGNQIATLMREGQELYAAKRYDEAIVKFRDVTTRDSSHVQGFVWLSRAYIARSSWTDAIASARRARELSPNEQDVMPLLAEALFGGGSAALAAGSFKAAIGHFTDYIALEPGNARAYLNVGRAFLGDKRFADALGALLKGLSQATGPERTEFLKGLIEGGVKALSEGEFGSAIAFLREALKLDPANIRAIIDLVKSLIGNGDYSGALSAIQEALKRVSGAERGELLHSLVENGRQALASGRAREAAGFFREVVKQDSANLRAYLDLARSYWQSGERGEALEAVRRALQIDPRSQDSLRLLLGG